MTSLEKITFQFLLKRKRLIDTAVPSVFPAYPVSNLSNIPECRKDSDDRRRDKENKNIQDAMNASIKSLDSYITERKIQCIDDVKKCIDNFRLSKYWLLYENCEDNFLYFVHIEPCPEPFTQYNIKINQELNLNVNVEKTPIEKLSNYSFPLKVDNFNHVTQIIDYIKNNDKKSKISSNFITELILNLLDKISCKENENYI